MIFEIFYFFVLKKLVFASIQLLEKYFELFEPCLEIEKRNALDSEIFIALTYETLCMKNVLSYKHTLVPTILDKALLRVRSFLFIKLTVTEIITI